MAMKYDFGRVTDLIGYSPPKLDAVTEAERSGIFCNLSRDGQLMELGKDPFLQVAEKHGVSIQTEGHLRLNADLVGRATDFLALTVKSSQKAGAASPAAQMLRLAVGLLGMEVHEQPNSVAEMWLSFEDRVMGDRLREAGLKGAGQAGLPSSKEQGAALPGAERSAGVEHKDAVEDWQSKVLDKLTLQIRAAEQARERAEQAAGGNAKKLKEARITNEGIDGHDWGPDFTEHLELARFMLKRISHAVGVLQDPEQIDRPMILNNFSESMAASVCNELRQWLEQLSTLFSLYHIHLLDLANECRNMKDYITSLETKNSQLEKEHKDAVMRHDRLQEQFRQSKLKANAEVKLGVTIPEEDLLIYSQKDMDDSYARFEKEELEPIMADLVELRNAHHDLLRKRRNDLEKERLAPQTGMNNIHKEQQFALAAALGAVAERLSGKQVVDVCQRLTKALAAHSDDIKDLAQELAVLLGTRTQSQPMLPTPVMSRQASGKGEHEKDEAPAKTPNSMTRRTPSRMAGEKGDAFGFGGVAAGGGVGPGGGRSTLELPPGGSYQARSSLPATSGSALDRQEPSLPGRHSHSSALTVPGSGTSPTEPGSPKRYQVAQQREKDDGRRPHDRAGGQSSDGEDSHPSLRARLRSGQLGDSKVEEMERGRDEHLATDRYGFKVVKDSEPSASFSSSEDTAGDSNAEASGLSGSRSTRGSTIADLPPWRPGGRGIPSLPGEAEGSIVAGAANNLEKPPPERDLVERKLGGQASPRATQRVSVAPNPAGVGAGDASRRKTEFQPANNRRSSRTPLNEKPNNSPPPMRFGNPPPTTATYLSNVMRGPDDLPGHRKTFAGREALRGGSHTDDSHSPAGHRGGSKGIGGLDPAEQPPALCLEAVRNELLYLEALLLSGTNVSLREAGAVAAWAADTVSKGKAAWCGFASGKRAITDPVRWLPAPERTSAVASQLLAQRAQAGQHGPLSALAGLLAAQQGGSTSEDESLRKLGESFASSSSSRYHPGGETATDAGSEQPSSHGAADAAAAVTLAAAAAAERAAGAAVTATSTTGQATNPTAGAPAVAGSTATIVSSLGSHGATTATAPRGSLGGAAGRGTVAATAAAATAAAIAADTASLSITGVGTGCGGGHRQSLNGGTSGSSQTPMPVPSQQACIPALGQDGIMGSSLQDSIAAHFGAEGSQSGPQGFGMQPRGPQPLVPKPPAVGLGPMDVMALQGLQSSVDASAAARKPATAPGHEGKDVRMQMLRAEIERKVREVRSFGKDHRRRNFQTLEQLTSEGMQVDKSMAELSTRLDRLEQILSTKGVEAKTFEAALAESGVKDFIRGAGNVFERLYRDALDRMHTFADIQTKQLEVATEVYFKTLQSVWTHGSTANDSPLPSSRGEKRNRLQTMPSDPVAYRPQRRASWPCENRYSFIPTRVSLGALEPEVICLMPERMRLNQKDDDDGRGGRGCAMVPFRRRADLFSYDSVDFRGLLPPLPGMGPIQEVRELRCGNTFRWELSPRRRMSPPLDSSGLLQCKGRQYLTFDGSEWPGVSAAQIEVQQQQQHQSTASSLQRTQPHRFQSGIHPGMTQLRTTGATSASAWSFASTSASTTVPRPPQPANAGQRRLPDLSVQRLGKGSGDETSPHKDRQSLPTPSKASKAKGHTDRMPPLTRTGGAASMPQLGKNTDRTFMKKSF